jgi:hypothetical protein
VILFLLLIIAAIALGIIGFVVKGLLYLLIIGVTVFLAGLIFFGGRRRGGRRRGGRRRGGRRPGGRRPGGPVIMSPDIR